MHAKNWIWLLAMLVMLPTVRSQDSSNRQAMEDAAQFRAALVAAIANGSKSPDTALADLKTRLSLLMELTQEQGQWAKWAALRRL